MKNKKELKWLIITLLVAIIIYLVLSSASKCALATQADFCSGGYTFGMSFSAFISNMFYVFLAMFFWFISPIGVLFLLGIKLFFSENASSVRRHIAMLIQFLSFLTWSSVMFILIVVYIDSTSYQVLGSGGAMLNLVIKSGLGFMIFMIILALAENNIINRQKCKLKNEKEKIKNIDENRREGKNSKFEENSGVKKGGIKNKIKNKIKEEIKEIIDNKIDKL
ncbi:hypothetical protein K0B03_00155 [Patescibacteria group bacterium]|nr:hypothetical protein [Patescibacteria group bacterium]